MTPSPRESIHRCAGRRDHPCAQRGVHRRTPRRDDDDEVTVLAGAGLHRSMQVRGVGWRWLRQQVDYGDHKLFPFFRNHPTCWKESGSDRFHGLVSLLLTLALSLSFSLFIIGIIFTPFVVALPPQSTMESTNQLRTSTNSKHHGLQNLCFQSYTLRRIEEKSIQIEKNNKISLKEHQNHILLRHNLQFYYWKMRLRNMEK